MQPIYSLRDIEKQRGAFQLWVKALDLFPGRLYALTGPNGSGKTTLLELLALLSPPDRGDFYYASEPVRWKSSRLNTLRQHVTMVPQYPFLFDNSVMQNITLGLKMRGVVGRRQRERIYAVMRDLGLDGFAERRARGLSGGESQKVALARALVLDPQVLLLDEPTANIDQQHIGKIEAFIPSLTQQGMTVVVVKHDQDQASRMGCETLALAEGRLAS